MRFLFAIILSHLSLYSALAIAGLGDDFVSKVRTDTKSLVWRGEGTGTTYFLGKPAMGTATFLFPPNFISSADKHRFDPFGVSMYVTDSKTDEMLPGHLQFDDNFKIDIYSDGTVKANCSMLDWETIGSVIQDEYQNLILQINTETCPGTPFKFSLTVLIGPQNQMHLSFSNRTTQGIITGDSNLQLQR